ncbi:DUF2862 domain-containing protein [Anabaena sp. FACHB-1237]|uniref:cytochrome b6f subunit PetP n=1 Tax=Anabaena sp. FACHB-1237 TaxID=2692769 RepID=UPI001680410B|nr:DUF2862 domain-containing protein [Anabaena sp. FACHB-1237]MBD2138275.1 DUF2862 domain-containing protein [Anabaena sp. FACHB-1237]
MQVGQNVKLVRLRDRVSSGIAGKLGKIGVITGYKVLDGGVGVIVKFDDNTSTWFFEDEVKAV